MNKGCRFAIWKNNKFLTGQMISVDRKLVQLLLKQGRAEIHNLLSKRTGKRYSATLIMECEEDGSPRFRFEFDHK